MRQGSKLKQRCLLVSRDFPLKDFCTFSVYTEPDYKFLQKAVDSYNIALYNPTFVFIVHFQELFYIWYFLRLCAENNKMRGIYGGNKLV